MIVNGININYVQYGNTTGKNVVLLHGWGQNTKMMDPIGNGLKDNFYITNIDLPGFGLSDEFVKFNNVFDYYKALDELLTKLNIENPILIGHSFGGRISIIYASMKNVEKLILMGTPYKKSTKKKSLKVKILNKLIKIPLLNIPAKIIKNKMGSVDYRNATEMMKNVLVNTVNTDLTDNLIKIKSPTLLIWGTNDTAVSIEDAREAEKIMHNAGLVSYEGCTHYAYLERLNQTIRVLDSFLNNDKE